MKKVLIVFLAVFAVAAVSQADVIRLWNPDIVFGGIPDPSTSGDPLVQGIHGEALADDGGNTWQVWVVNLDDVSIDPFTGVGLELGTPVNELGPLYFSSNTPSQPNLGYQSGAGSFVLQGGTNFPLRAPEGATIGVVLFGNSDGPTAPEYSWILSAPLDLPSYGADFTPAPEDLEIAFSFAGSEWQAIPEPGTVAVMLMGGLGLLVSRRRRVKAGV